VPTHDIAAYRDPLDLLHRFVPTPLNSSFQLDCATVMLQTNDLSFFPSAETAPEFSASSRIQNQPPQSCLWKIVRDADMSQDLAEPSTIISDDLLVYSMGPACIIAADRARRELLAFIGTSVDARAYQLTILPMLYRLTEFVTHSAPDSVAHADRPPAAGDHCNA
jgi:hypothetical protein